MVIARIGFRAPQVPMDPTPHPIGFVPVADASSPGGDVVQDAIDRLRAQLRRLDAFAAKPAARADREIAQAIADDRAEVLAQLRAFGEEP